MEDRLGSTEAIKRIEGAFDVFCEREGFDRFVYWNWGYEFEMLETHRWESGTLWGYWLAVEDEYQGLKPRFERARQYLEGLDIVSEIKADSYRHSVEDGMLLGETWVIEFTPEIFYDHK